MKKTSMLLSMTAVALAVQPLCSVADIPGGWLSRKWDPGSTNDIPRCAMPADLHGPDSPITQRVRTAKSASRSTASGNVAFSPGGLAGRLPAADGLRIRELANGLDHNWERCFEFVRNEIAYAPYPGIVKGPERTLLDREGNAADQAFLLCALLRASGYETATVLYAPLEIT